MRKYTILAGLSYVAVLALFSCSKNNSQSAALPSSSYNMLATVTNSGSITAFTAIGQRYVTALKSQNTCTITASDTSGANVISNFTFVITNYRDTGTYTYDSSSASKADYESSGPANTQTAFAYGTIVITSISHENISGTFSGTLTDGSVITNGKFTALGKGF